MRGRPRGRPILEAIALRSARQEGADGGAARRRDRPGMIFYECKHLKPILLQYLALSPQFLAGLTAGRVPDWGKLYDHYAGALYGIILQQVSEEIAPKILEKCWLTFFQTIEEFCPAKERLFTWMYRLTMMACRDAILLPDDLKPISYLSIVPLGVRAN